MLPLGCTAERLRGSRQQRKEAGAPDTPRVRKGGQSEESAPVKFFPRTLQIWEIHHKPWQLQTLGDCCEVSWAH